MEKILVIKGTLTLLRCPRAFGRLETWLQGYMTKHGVYAVAVVKGLLWRASARAINY